MITAGNKYYQMIDSMRVFCKNMWLLCFFMLLGFELSGQGAPPLSCVEDWPEEQVKLLTDRDFYMVGEELWFKAYTFVDGKLSSDWSKVLYIELFNERQDIFVQEKYELYDGTTAGSFVIPDGLNTGHYFLRAYTRYQINFPSESFFTRVVSVINPMSEVSEVQMGDNDKASEILTGQTFDTLGGININVSVNKQKVCRREKVILTIESAPATNLTVAVRKKGSAHTKADMHEYVLANPWLKNTYSGLPQGEKLRISSREKKHDRSTELRWAPEIRGVTLSGMVRNKVTGQPVPDIYCITSVIGEAPQLHMAKTFTDGSFIFPFHHLKNDKDIFIAIRGDANRDLDILINNDFSSTFPEIQPMVMAYDSSRHAVFEALFINSQLRRTFEMPFKETTYGLHNSDLPAFNIGSPDLTIDIKDFIDIPTMPEVFRELIPTVSVRGKVGNRKLNVFNKDAYKDLRNPLVLLDNVPVTDVDKLLQMDPSKLREIKVFNADYLLGDHAFEGIISLKTNTADFAGFKWTDNSVFLGFKGIKDTGVFEHPVYSAGAVSTKPDFRTVLYWNPDPGAGGNNSSLTFFASDHVSLYEVVVQGFTHSGIPCYGRVEFEVLK